MLKKVSLIGMSCLILLLLFGCSASSSSSENASQVELRITAAASLTDALNELKASFEKEHPNIKLSFQFGSSGKLARQIEQGAPSDLFLSASKKDMDDLQSKKLVVEHSRVDFAQNELVLITPKDKSFSISSFEQIRPDQIQHFAIGEPESVPAGRYTKEALQKLKLWDKLEKKFVMGSDVRQVLAFVESGNAEMGIVYASDAQTAKNVKVLATAKPEWHKPIVYPGAIIAHSAHQKEAQTFLSYLNSEAGKQVLKKYGFK
ncbi:molybdate ABC transporter substrate-binding protein [Thermoflavimicrobium dichotomicum]|uniref:Molybdate transport system substrate-binding protein n=1 Tax=Thermoflavimicrobium dichotomicum TaxID=46223 RepID=A0A1I3MYC0_9BACL|nr:molybdate ABC transporter substrate-binding protein [Thermoflavimicrobium dichotomicum]SFJ01951.1 molybdate transport system substrate-binding protein [Thermoflavimicrobium dichotomicum]